MSIKQFLTFSLTLIIINIAFGQDNYEKFVNALINGDTILAQKISDQNTTVEQIETRKFQTKNVAEHVFNIESTKLKDTIISLFSLDNQFENKILSQVFYSKVSETFTMNITFQAETNKDTLFSKEYFSHSNSSNDIFLHNFREYWPSKYYYSQKNSLEYTANFIIKLNKISDSSTRVLIIADSPEVINGISGYGVHGPVARHTSVQSTTIEEYTILEFISKKLGDKTLSPIKLPDEK